MNKQEILKDNLEFWRAMKGRYLCDGYIFKLLEDDINLAAELGDEKAANELKTLSVNSPQWTTGATP